jgi:hypothetical protein
MMFHILVMKRGDSSDSSFGRKEMEVRSEENMLSGGKVDETDSG